MAAMTLSEAFEYGYKILHDAGVPDARYDAFRLLEHVTGIGHALYLAQPDAAVSTAQEREYREAVDMRAKRIPLQHIEGSQEFMGLKFRVNENVLIPRQDTETLVETALELARDCEIDPLHILDIGCGSGCILISLVHALRGAGRMVRGTGVDISPEALLVARQNAEDGGVTQLCVWTCSDLFEGVSGRFELIVSNPPYIPTRQIADLEPEVRDHDPRGALDGGEDGLDYYRRIISEAGDYLAAGGWLALEAGFGQSGKIRELLDESAFRHIMTKKDLAGVERVVVGQAVL